jgi:hypothetical protein
MSSTAKEAFKNWTKDKMLRLNANCFGREFSKYVKECKTASDLAGMDLGIKEDSYKNITKAERDYMWRNIIFQ